MSKHILSKLMLSSMVLASAPGCLADAELAGGGAIAESESALSFGTTLLSGTTMVAKDTLTSANGAYTAILQSDGNFVIYDNSTGKPTWATGSNGPDRSLVLQGDGNLVIYAAGAAVWASGSAEQPTGAFFLELEDSGSLVLYKGTPASPEGTLWSSRDDRLIRKYAPIVRFHPDEDHFPVDMITFYRNSSLRNASGQLLLSEPQTEGPIAGASSADKEDYLDLAARVYAGEVTMTTSPGGFPMPGMTVTPPMDGYNAGAPMYAHVVDYTKDGVAYHEIVYSMLFAYNGCEMFRAGTKDDWWDSMTYTTFRWCAFGRHEGDWEHVTVRVNAATGQVTDVYTNAHGRKDAHGRDDFEWRNNHPIVYVGLSSHGTYAHADTWHYETIIDADWGWAISGIAIPAGLYKLDVVDVTADGGHEWDSQRSVRLIGDARAITRFRGRWGLNRLDNAQVQDPEGNVPYVEDLAMRDTAQALFDYTDELERYRVGSGPNAPWTADWFWNGEGR
ncbi:uncharacterized protein SOCEGT47_030250 [Sorangium cellulosum]|uniref:Bulb-type lectin domain-containing protein n=1 Tax=Sorangium cellulosum TaxID=56 RepID=A0A4V0NDF8_SORCE|nr:Vps62-related protein [Sorangium cellulosum]AUX22522.1 uncharacterized protein SOCEGT47_030250 [Sorangium cellulosum]